MKLNKKTLIIIVVAAVAAYLLWRRSKQTTVIEAAGTIVAGPDPNNLDDCIAVAFGNDKYAATLAARSRKVYTANKATLTLQEAFAKKAAQNGFTFEQQAVVDGCFLECYKKDERGQWVPRSADHQYYQKMVIDRVKAM